jgi:hypothetical protein
VRTPAGEVVVDPTGKAPGRGAYVCADEACQEAALKKGALRRALEVPVPAALFGAAAEASPTAESTSHEGGA